MSELRQCSRRLAAECGFIAIGGICVALSSCGGTEQREIEHGTAGGGVSATNSQNRGGWFNVTTRATTGGKVGSGPSSASSNPPTGGIGPGGSGSGGVGLGGDSSRIATGQTEASGGTPFAATSTASTGGAKPDTVALSQGGSGEGGSWSVTITGGASTVATSLPSSGGVSSSDGWNSGGAIFSGGAASTGGASSTDGSNSGGASFSGGATSTGGTANGGHSNGDAESAGAAGVGGAAPPTTFCGNFDQLVLLQKEKPIDQLVINCLVINRAVEDSERVLARTIEVRDQGVRYEGDFCQDGIAPNLWLKASERVLIQAPINLAGQDGRPNAPFGSTCTGDGLGGGSVGIGAPEIVVDATINISGGNGRPSLDGTNQVAGNGGWGGYAVFVATGSVTLGKSALFIRAGGAASEAGGEAGIEGQVATESHIVKDFSEDQWNQSLFGGLSLMSDTTVNASMVPAISGYWQAKIPGDYVEDVYSFYIEQAPASVSIRLDSDTPGVDLDLYLAHLASLAVRSEMLAFSNGPSSHEVITATLSDSGAYVVFVQQSNDSPAPGPAQYKLGLDQP